MFEQFYPVIKRHALMEYPNECCGMIVGNEYIPRNNLAENPRESFKISYQAYVAASRLGEVRAIVHSHPNGPDCPSEADMALQLNSHEPWVIVSTNGKHCTQPFEFGDQLKPLSLLKRGFRHGVHDCYAIIRDWYRIERGITIKEFPRDWEWWLSGQRLYEDGFKEAGFVRIAQNEVREGDVFLASIGSDTPNHGGVYTGNGLILHHLTGRLPVELNRLSKEEPVHRWTRFISHWLRYVG